MNFGAARLGFWFRPPVVATGTLANACSLFPDFTKADLDALPTAPTNNKYTINNNHIKYTLNGWGEGAIGDNVNGLGLMFSPNGDGNFGVDDYIRPGLPWEGYLVKAGTNIIGGSNTDTAGGGIDFPPGTSIWSLGGPNNHYVVLRGNNTFGYVIVQYMTFPGEPIIRIKMTYQNTTGSTQYVKMIRGVDPDVDVDAFGTYDTQNQRGFGSIPGTDLVYSIGVNSGKPLSLYVPGNGYTHNTAVTGDWPLNGYDFNIALSGRNDGNGDWGIVGAWDIGNVANGASVSVCCYYICGSNLADVVAAIGA
jgi:hypothetical protein